MQKLDDRPKSFLYEDNISWVNKLYPKLRGFLMGLIEIYGVFSDTPCNLQIFSDSLENSKGSNISFDVEKVLWRRG